MKSGHQSVFTKLPADVAVNNLFPFFTMGDKHRILQVNQHCKQRFKGAFDKFTLQKLINHVMRGEQKEAEAMLKQNSSLLLKRGHVAVFVAKDKYQKIEKIDSDATGSLDDQYIANNIQLRLKKNSIYEFAKVCGTGVKYHRCGVKDIFLYDPNDTPQEVEGTAYQIALATENKKMAKMIQGYLLKLQNGNEEIKRQQQQQFPEMNKEKEKRKQQAGIDALNTIIKVVGDSRARNMKGLTNDPVIIEALQKFKNHLKQKSVITEGKYFNSELLLKAFELYDDEARYNAFGGWYQGYKNVFLWTKVIGYMLWYRMPACYAPAFIACVPYEGTQGTSEFFQKFYAEQVAAFESLLRPPVQHSTYCLVM